MTDQSDVRDETEARRYALYNTGTTTVFASRADPRFSYSLFVPPSAGPSTSIIVAVHGTGRRMFEMRDSFAEFGRYNDCLVLAPLFPVGPLGNGDSNGYKYILEDDIRYDRVLLGMVGEIADRYGVREDRFFLHGFSGGGHFTHRFLYLHPHRLRAVSIGAPGSVTLPSDEHDFWVGCRDLEAVFGVPLDVEAMRRVPAHLVVGGADTETWEITHKPGAARWMEGANSAGATRIDRIRTLNDALVELGVDTRLDILPGVAHESVKAAGAAKAFFLDVLQGRVGAD